MKRKLLIIGLIFIVGFAFGQTANRLAWRDFDAFIGLIGNAESNIQQIYNQVVSLQSEKIEIMDDQERLAELTKIIRVHPDYTIESISAKYVKLVALKTWLENNGYIEEE